MTVQKQAIKRYLQLQVTDGLKGDGSTKYKNVSYKVKADGVTDENLLNTAKAIETLIDNQLNNVAIVTTEDILEEE